MNLFVQAVRRRPVQLNVWTCVNISRDRSNESRRKHRENACFAVNTA